MKFPIVLLLFAVLTFSATAQVTARRALRPLDKQGLIPPSGAPAGHINAPAPAPASTAAKPAAAPAIEADLKPSPISLFGKLDGLSGTLYVTNVGAKAVAPFVQLAVVDKSGKALGWVTNGAPEIQPKESAKIQVLATNVAAVDFKIVRLVGRGR